MGWTFKVNGYMLFALAWLLVWEILLAASVNEPMVVHPAGTICGWKLLWGGTSILVPTVIVGFIAGYFYHEDSKGG